MENTYTGSYVLPALLQIYAIIAFAPGCVKSMRDRERRESGRRVKGGARAHSSYSSVLVVATYETLSAVATTTPNTIATSPMPMRIAE